MTSSSHVQFSVQIHVSQKISPTHCFCEEQGCYLIISLLALVTFTILWLLIILNQNNVSVYYTYCIHLRALRFSEDWHGIHVLMFLNVTIRSLLFSPTWFIQWWTFVVVEPSKSNLELTLAGWRLSLTQTSSSHISNWDSSLLVQCQITCGTAAWNLCSASIKCTNIY